MATILDEMVELEDGRKVPPASLSLEIVKGAAAAMGVDKLSVTETQELHKAAEIAFHESLRPMRRGFADDDDWGRVSPELKYALRGASKSAGANDDFLQQMYRLAQNMPKELQKDITLTSPVSTGLVPYDLAMGARMQYPVYSPIRNKIPRTTGEGVAKHFKKITSITNSGGAPWTSFFMAELPAGSFASLNYPTSMTMSGSDATVNYAFAGLGNNASLLAQIAGRGFQDIDALLNQTLLQGMMQSEEIAMLYSRTSVRAAPGLLAAGITPQTPSTGYAVISGMTTNIYVKVTTVTGMGESAGSTARAPGTAPSGSQDVKITWPDVPGAIYYNVYVSTGSSDPGDASRFFWGSTPTNSIELGGALPTAGTTVPTVDTTTTTNGYLGMVGDLSINAGYTARLNAGFTSGCPELQTAFGQLYSVSKARPEEVWLSGHDRLSASNQIIGNGSANQAYRVAYSMDEAGRLTGGQVVTALYNSTTGDEVPITVHPWLQQGTALILSYKLPFAYSETPNVWENVMVQDYLGLAFPQFDLARRYAIVMYGALVDWAPIYNGIIQGIAF
jgi:hypothetical protein